jgi:hypothetical protein
VGAVIRRALLLMVVGLVLWASGNIPAAADAASNTTDGRPDQVILQIDAVSESIGLSGTGLAYLSPVHEAPRPFTHMLLRWEASEPVEGELVLEVRASYDGTTWTDWVAAGDNHDMWMPSDGDDVHWSQVLYAGEGMRFWQVRAESPADSASVPELRRIDVNTTDARFGSDDPLPEYDLNGGSLATIGKPPVVSRTAWGNPDGQGSRAPIVHYPVKHLVLHHTAGSNSLGGGESSWADRVRSIWSFHTYTRGWGDIGYNYLIDPNGRIYEGRAGGDDAVGFHDTANYGSMGVVVIGSYQQVAPPAASIDALVELLAWKARQKRIDPLGRSYYYGCAFSRYCNPFNNGAIVANISGHREVTPGRTTCPGDEFVAQLASIRQRVQARANGESGSTPPSDNGDLLIDEQERSFERSAANWYNTDCGYGGAVYTFATDDSDESANIGVWRPNIPEAGIYRILAYVPDGCGLGPSTTRATYRIHHANGVSERQINQATTTGWVDLGSYQFNAGISYENHGHVALDDLTGEPFSVANPRYVFFDSVRWVKEDPEQARLELLDVAYDRTTVAAGELLQVTFTVRNSGSVPIESQAPQAGTRSDAAASYDLANSYVYDEGECFLGAADQAYPAYPKEAGRVRVMLGPTNRSLACSGDHGGYPWRWGLNGTLEPGETRAVVGYVRFRDPGSVTLQAGVIHEYVAYVAREAFQQTITVTPERIAPVPLSYDELLMPQAHVYRLADIPDNLLARTHNALSIGKDRYIGAFTWDGTPTDWGAGGPLGMSDSFVIEQTRVFVAPTSGEYTFELLSDDGAWLWIDGAAVVEHPGLHSASTARSSVYLTAGRHVLSYKYFERSGNAAAGYRVLMPGYTRFIQPIDGLAGSGSRVDYERVGSTFRSLSGLYLAADDQGGSGASRMRWSYDGLNWFDDVGAVLSLGSLVDGTYSLYYQAVDAAGNESAIQRLQLRVDSTLAIERRYFPVIVQ